MSRGYMDLHSHVLPAIDDGVKSLEEGVNVAKALFAMGFSHVCATPHQKEGSYLPSAETIDGAHQRTAAALATALPQMELLLGAENYWDATTLGRLTTPLLRTYSGGRAFLFEIDPRMAPPNIENTLFQARLAGRLPVMAHPERYQPYWAQPDRLEALARTTALVVDLGALDGAHGRKEREVARRLVEGGLAHACASDAHSLADARSAAAGLKWIEKRLGNKSLTRLVHDGPRQILNGELPD